MSRGDCTIKSRTADSHLTPNSPRRRTARLEGTRDITHDIREFAFRADGSATFLAGQYAMLVLPGSTAGCASRPPGPRREPRTAGSDRVAAVHGFQQRLVAPRIDASPELVDLNYRLLVLIVCSGGAGVNPCSAWMRLDASPSVAQNRLIPHGYPLRRLRRSTFGRGRMSPIDRSATFGGHETLVVADGHELKPLITRATSPF